MGSNDPSKIGIIIYICKLKSEEKGSNMDTLLHFMCAMKNQISTSLVTVQCVSMVILTSVWLI